MIRRLLNRAFFAVAILAVSGSVLYAQDDPQPVTLRDLNTYPYDLTTLDSLPKHPLVGKQVKFTAVLSSYPKDSGLASYNAEKNSIGRVHLFVVDTTAASLGRDGMAMQIVQPSSMANFEEIENLLPGAILDIEGNLTFYNFQAQFNITKIDDVSENIDEDLRNERYYELLKPVEVHVSDLNSLNEDGSIQINLANYSKYAHAYVKITGGTVQFSDGPIARPNYAIKDNGTEHLVYSNDVSLRYRNDKSVYRTGYNTRRDEDGVFAPPAAGAKVNYSGYTVVNNFDPYGKLAAGQQIFKMTPMDDGVLWVGDVRNVNGENGFVWPNDLEIVGFPPEFDNFAISVEKPSPTDVVTVSVDITTSSQSATLTSVKMMYTVNGTDGVMEDMTKDGNTYSYTFPSFDDGSLVAYKILATDSEDLVGEFSGSFLVATSIKSIAALQKTANEGIGNSPYNGLGLLTLDINATVVSGFNDGLVVIHESNEAWSGIFLKGSETAVKTLVRGDKINLTAGEVMEDYNNSGATYLQNVEFTKTGTDEDYADLIPSLLTQDVTSNPEAWEGMVVKFTDVKLTTNQADGASDFGEFEIGSRQGGDVAKDTLVAGTGLRVNDDYPPTTTFGTGNQPPISSNFNENLKPNAQFDSVIGMVYFSHSFPKLELRKMEDLAGDDFTYPTRNITLLSPTDETSSDLSEDVQFTWTNSVDFDGNQVGYLVGFSKVEDETRTFLDFFKADGNGNDNAATIAKEDLDAFLADLGVAEAGSADLEWSVFIHDAADTVQTSTYSGVTFTPVWKKISFTRLGTATEDLGRTYEFELSQNYPNPFNPSTEIKFTVPAASQVELSVYNVLGQKVATLVNTNMTAGVHTATFNATSFSSGVYFYRLDAGNQVSIKKMLLIK